MENEKIIVEITYNSRGLSEIIVGDISLEIEAIRGKSIQEWFTPFKGRISWKGLIPEIKEAIQDDDAEFEFEFLGRTEYKSMRKILRDGCFCVVSRVVAKRISARRCAATGC